MKVLKDRGIEWAVNRSLYGTKLVLLREIPLLEGVFEKEVGKVDRINIFDIDLLTLKEFLGSELSEAQKRELICEADEASKGVIKGFSCNSLDYGDPIDWQKNPLTGMTRSKNTKWFNIPDFNEDYGDIKAAWEISRFCHFVTIARAYLLSEDKKYYRAFSSQLASWLRDNQYGYGINFKYGQECAIMINCLLAYSVFAEIADVAVQENVKELVLRCYKKIRSNFFYAYKCIKNNHTISELTGLIVGAWCCKDDEQIDKAYSILDEVIKEQFLEDGGYVQQSFNYQRLALQDIKIY